MAADMFSNFNACSLLENKTILFFGDSNMRAIYKDLIWLLEYGDLIPQCALKKKNEIAHANDRRLSNGELTNSCNYEEIREYYKNGLCIKFEFLTRIYQLRFIQAMENLKVPPAVLIINSCLWDISRYGPQSINEYQYNIVKTMELLKKALPFTKVIWTTTLPPSPKCRGGFLNEEAKYIQSLLPFHIAQANNCLIEYAKQYNMDILDLHYHMKFLIDIRSSDGIHWSPEAVRYMTNLLLTHISICWGHTLPMNVPLSGEYMSDYNCVQFSYPKIKFDNNVFIFGNGFTNSTTSVNFKNRNRRERRNPRNRRYNNRR